MHNLMCTVVFLLRDHHLGTDIGLNFIMHEIIQHLNKQEDAFACNLEVRSAVQLSHQDLLTLPLLSFEAHEFCLYFPYVDMQGWGNILNLAVLLFFLGVQGQTGPQYSFRALSITWRMQYALGLLPIIFMLVYRIFYLKESSVWQVSPPCLPASSLHLDAPRYVCLCMTGASLSGRPCYACHQGVHASST